MSTLKKVVAVAAIVLGVIFLLNSPSDVQLGFGAILVALGVFHL